MSKTFPQKFGKYILLQKIAMGGMAEIFRAKTTGAEGFEREVVIKRILPHFTEDEAFVNMFIDEATLAAKLNHANIVQIFDFDRIEDTYYIAMEYIEGKDLKKTAEVSRKEGNRPLTVPQCVRIIIEAAKGLHYAHTRKHKNKALNLVHRDVSPHNIMVSYNGEVKLMDFGIAKAASRSTSTQAGTVKGKCAYMAPEQARGGGLDGRTDLFALAVVFWELLTAKRLFAGDSDFATLSNVLKCEVDPPSKHNSAIPEELDEIILKALSKDPDDRFQDVAAFSNALQKLLYSTVTDSGQVNLTDFMQDLFENDIQALAELQASEETVHLEAVGSDSTVTATSAEEESEAKTMAVDAVQEELDSEAATMAVDTSALTEGGDGAEDATIALNTDTTALGKKPAVQATGSVPLNTVERKAVGDSKNNKWIGIGAALVLVAGLGIWGASGGDADLKDGPGDSSNAGADTTAEAPPLVEITFVVEPSNAVVYVDEKAINGKIYSGEADSSTIQAYAMLDGQKSPTETIRLSEAQKISLTVPKAPEKPKEESRATVEIQAPEDVNIEVGGKVLGKGNVKLEGALIGNEVLIAAYRDNGKPFEKSVQVLREGQIVVIPGTRVPEGRTTAKWTITVLPPDAKVTFNETVIVGEKGIYSLDTFFVGDVVNIKATKPGLSSLTRTLTLGEPAGEKKYVLTKSDPAASGFGYVTINAKPWADVYHRGRKLGTTPLVKVKVPAGRQSFKLKQMSNVKKVSLRIKKGQTTSKIVDMSQ